MQKIYHKKCLEEWDNRCKLLNKIFVCPECKYELPLTKWKEKVNYEDERNNEVNMLSELNKLKENKNNNMNNSIDKDEYNFLKKNYSEYMENASNLFKTIFHKTIEIISLINDTNINQDNMPINDINEINNNIWLNFKIIENFIIYHINTLKIQILMK